MKVEEQYAKSKARVKVLKDLEGDNFNPAISHYTKIDMASNPVNNMDIQSGMMPTRKGIMPKEFEAHQNVEAHQAPDMSFHDIKIGDECSNIKAMLPSAEPTDMLWKGPVSSRCGHVFFFMLMSWNIITSWHYSEKSLRVRLKIQEAD